MRNAGLLLMTVALALLLGCPQPIENSDGTVPLNDDGAVSADVSMHRTGETGAGDAVPGDDSEPLENGDVSDDDVAPVADEDTGEETGPAPVDDDAEPPAEEELSGDELPFIFRAPAGPGPEAPEAVEPDPADDEVPVGGKAPVVVEEPEEPHGALDPGRMLAGEPEEHQRAFSEPAPRVSRESYAFAGEWTVAVVHQDGRAEQLPADDAWTFNLADDGKCGVTQVVDREEWTQRGGWEYVGGELTLRLGPGGQRSYEVFQPEQDPDVAILTDDATNAVLFCLRIDPAVRVPKPAKHYESDFGPVAIRQSGQVYWSGTYGEPEGKLNFRMTGQYMAGTWEQAPGKGFILLKLLKDSFSGWWWYEASTEFDGTWRGSAKSGSG